MDQRWQDVVTFLNLQQGNGGHPHGDGSGGPLPLSHTFGSHLHHHGAPLHHHHHHHFSAPPPSAPYNADSARSVLLQNATLPPPDVSSPYSMGKFLSYLVVGKACMLRGEICVEEPCWFRREGCFCILFLCHNPSGFGYHPSHIIH